MARLGYRNIYESSKFLFIILKSLGLAPYTFEEKSRKLKMGFANYVHFFISIIIWITFTVIQTSRFRLEVMDSGVKSKFLDRLWQYQYLFQYYLVTFTVIFNLLKRKHVERFLQFIFKFDEILLRYGCELKTANIRQSIVFVVFIVSVTMTSTYMIIFTILEEELKFYHIIKSLAYVSVTEFFFVISLQFINSAACVCYRLKALTKNFW